MTLKSKTKEKVFNIAKKVKKINHNLRLVNRARRVLKEIKKSYILERENTVDKVNVLSPSHMSINEVYSPFTSVYFKGFQKLERLALGTGQKEWFRYGSAKLLNFKDIQNEENINKVKEKLEDSLNKYKLNGYSSERYFYGALVSWLEGKQYDEDLIFAGRHSEIVSKGLIEENSSIICHAKHPLPEVDGYIINYIFKEKKEKLGNIENYNALIVPKDQYDILIQYISESPERISEFLDIFGYSNIRKIKKNNKDNLIFMTTIENGKYKNINLNKEEKPI